MGTYTTAVAPSRSGIAEPITVECKVFRDLQPEKLVARSSIRNFVLELCAIRYFSGLKVETIKILGKYLVNLKLDDRVE